jgi:hypothetical protein
LDKFDKKIVYHINSYKENNMKYKSEAELMEELLESIYSGDVSSDDAEDTEDSNEDVDDKDIDKKDDLDNNSDDESNDDSDDKSDDDESDDSDDDNEESDDESDDNDDESDDKGSDGKSSDTSSGPFTSKIRSLQKQYNDLLVDAFEKYAPECIEDALDETESAFGENIDGILQSALDKLKAKIMNDLGVDITNEDDEGIMPPSAMGSGFDPAVAVDTPMSIEISKS